MPINIREYIDIRSRVAGASALQTRELIGRFFTDNNLLPTDTIKEFTSATLVGDYFGTTSEEYKRARDYFSFVSKDDTSPTKISFARWVTEAVPPMIFGGELPTLTALKLITAGSFNLTLGGVTNTIGPLDFSGAASFAAIATILQVAITSETGTQWTSSTVEYDSTSGGFNFEGGDPVVANVIVAAPPSGTNISDNLNWLNNTVDGAIWSDGQIAESVTDILTNSTEANDNFGSFFFMPAITVDQAIEAAAWNTLENNQFQSSICVTPSNATAISEALIGYSGSAMTLWSSDDEYPAQFNMAILAAIDWSAPNSVPNFMYQQGVNLSPSVTDTVTAEAYNILRVNYYGQTQSAGTNLSFYQRGYLTGNVETDAVDMATYSGEQWLKARILSVLMNLFIAVSKISANTDGISQVRTAIEATPIPEAKTNGVISVGKPLDGTQRAKIKELAGGNNAAVTAVVNFGYWLNVYITTALNSASITEYFMNYTLIYSKGDVIRKINGEDILI